MLYLSNQTLRTESGLFIQIILSNTATEESFPILTIPWSDEAISIVQSADFWYAGTWSLITEQLQLLIEASRSTEVV